MNKKLFAFLFIFIMILFIPRNGFAKGGVLPQSNQNDIFELCLPSNYVDEYDLYSNYTMMDLFVSILLNDLDGFINYDTENDVIVEDVDGNKHKFSTLPGVTDQDLVFNINSTIRNRSIQTFGFDIFEKYSKFKYCFKEFNLEKRSDFIIDFTTINNIFDMNSFNYILLQHFQQNNVPIDSPFYIVSPNGGIPNDIFSIYSSNDKKLVELSFVNNNSSIKIMDDVTYLDNLEYKFNEDIIEYYEQIGLNVNSIKLIFAHEPKPEIKPESSTNKIIKKIKNNPQTYNGALISIMILILALSGFVLARKLKNN